jgi:hypothetical protein
MLPRLLSLVLTKYCHSQEAQEMYGFVCKRFGIYNVPQFDLQTTSKQLPKHPSDFLV